MNKTGILSSTKINKDRNSQIPKVSIGLNIAILAMIIIAFASMFAGLQPGQYPIYNPQKEGQFPGVYPSSKPLAAYLAYFAMILNMIMAIVAIINIIYFTKLKRKQIASVPKWLHVVNMSLASNLLLNFAFSLLYLMPLAAATRVYYFAYVFTASNLIFNAVTPLFALFVYLYCFKGTKLTIKESLMGSIPLVAYVIVYGAFALANIKDGKIAPEYDLYGFGMKYFWLVIVAGVVILGCSVGFNIFVCWANNKATLNRLRLVQGIDIFLACAIPFFTILMFYHNMCQDCYEEGLTPWQTFGLRFLFFTHWSNWLLGVACVIQAVYIGKANKGKIKTIPEWVQVCKLATVSAITITLLMQYAVAAGHLADGWTQHNIDLAYKEAFYRHLIFEHFIVPVTAIASWIVLEHSEIKFKNIFYAALPLAFYVLVYVIVLYICILTGQKHGDYSKGEVTPWDIYNIIPRLGLGKTGLYIYWAFPILIYALLFGINWIFWIINRKIKFNYPKAPSVKIEFAQWKANRDKSRIRR